MADFKDFDIIIAEEAEHADEAPSFKLRGITFACVVRPSAAAILKLVEASADPNRSLVGTVAYIAAMVKSAQRDEFKAIVSDEGDNGISLDVLTEISTFLLEAYSARPTPAP